MMDQPAEPNSGRSPPPGLEARVAVLEEIAVWTKAAIDRLERRLDGLEDNLTRRIDRLEDRQIRDFRWLLGFMVSGFAGLATLMARGFHWY